MEDMQLLDDCQPQPAQFSSILETIKSSCEYQLGRVCLEKMNSFGITIEEHHLQAVLQSALNCEDFKNAEKFVCDYRDSLVSFRYFGKLLTSITL